MLALLTGLACQLCVNLVYVRSLCFAFFLYMCIGGPKGHSLTIAILKGKKTFL